MKGQIVISETGRRYYNYYHKKGRDSPYFNRPHLKTVLIITKEGKTRWGYPLKLKPSPTNSYEANRHYCLRRDNYTCQQCGKFTAHPQLYYKDGFSYSKTKHPNNHPDNLMTLCRQCHMRLHRGITDKWTEIHTLRDMGLTLAAIGKEYKVSRQRIHQILNKPNYPTLNASV